MCLDEYKILSLKNKLLFKKTQLLLLFFLKELLIQICFSSCHGLTQSAGKHHTAIRSETRTVPLAFKGI